MSQLKASVDGASVSEDTIIGFLPEMLADDSVFDIVARVEVYPEKITIWTILDADPNGKFDFSDNADGLIINLGDSPPAPIFIINPGILRFSISRIVQK